MEWERREVSTQRSIQMLLKSGDLLTLLIVEAMIGQPEAGHSSTFED